LFSLLGIFSRNSNGFILEEKNIIVDIRREWITANSKIYFLLSKSLYPNSKFKSNKTLSANGK
jgi:hypothetical protein